MAHSFKALRPYLLEKPFKLHTDNASLQWLQQLERHATTRAPTLLVSASRRITCRPPATSCPFRCRLAVSPGRLPRRSISLDCPESPVARQGHDHHHYIVD